LSVLIYAPEEPEEGIPVDPLHRVESHVVLLPFNDIDTDQIIPARYLKITDKEGLADGLFADWRRRADGQLDPAFPLNSDTAASAQILMTGDNFGCGSSREHAAWALRAWGFRAVVSTSFADIFRNNAVGSGIIPVEISGSDHARMMQICAAKPYARIVVDLESVTVVFPEGAAAPFTIDAFARHCLLAGVDQLEFLLSAEAEIAAFEARAESAAAAAS
jgi:3-isopropylmalate/(R)-2-methylmalate dehydratase small subunit